jgi:DNA-binding response OmpR family regulator
MDKILVQETDQDILDILAIVLKQGGYKVMTTIGCDEILDQIDQFRPHMVMLDYKLKGHECIKAYREIRGKYPHLPVIALSCNSNIHSEYSKVGFDGYIEKPFDIDHMYSILREHMPHHNNQKTSDLGQEA